MSLFCQEVMTYKIIISHIITSNTPRHLPSLPMTPASSRTSRIAVTDGSSSGSTPPPGTIQLSGRREDVTSNTYAQNTMLHLISHYYHCYISIKSTQTSVSASDRTQIQAARRLNPSSSYIRIELGFSLTISKKHVNTNKTDD